MSRILKRPMFRRGGQAMDGVMSLAAPRRQYSEGNLDPRIQAIAEKYNVGDDTMDIMKMTSEISGLGRPSSNDLIAKALISGGLKGMSTAGKGGTLANLASAFEKPVDEALTSHITGKQSGVSGALTGLGLGLKLKDEKYKSQLKKQFAADLAATKVQSILKLVGDSPARKHYRNVAMKLQKAYELGHDVDVPLSGDIDDKNNTIKPSYYKNKDNVLFINPFTNRFEGIKEGRRVLVNQETLEFVQEN